MSCSIELYALQLMRPYMLVITATSSHPMQNGMEYLFECGDENVCITSYDFEHVGTVVNTLWLRR